MSIQSSHLALMNELNFYLHTTETMPKGLTSHKVRVSLPSSCFPSTNSPHRTYYYDYQVYSMSLVRYSDMAAE